MTADPNAWKEREITKMDEALTRFLRERDELNEDGLADARAMVVDELLDLRNSLSRGATSD